MSELVVIVFSKDRPFQLDAALRSAKLNGLDSAVAGIHVLYKATSPSFATWYRVVANEHLDVTLHREHDFKVDLLGLVEGSEHVLFFVDDTLAVGPVDLARAIRALDQDERCLGFSLRLGRNTTHCYTMNKPQRVPSFESVDPETLTFDWTSAEYDFGYPLELSSSLYRTTDILPLIRTLAYSNPNVLEAALAKRAPAFRVSRPRLACFAQSVAFSVPANLVQEIWQNRTGSDPQLSVNALASAYAGGKRLDVERYRGLVPSACHQELEFFMTRRPDVPTVSVVIPCHGQAEYLPSAVASVIDQTYTDWDLIVVDDGSPDDTASVTERLILDHPERHIRLLRQSNGGLARARNAGIAVSKGRYVLPLDADDQIAPGMLAATVATLDSEPATSIVYTDWQRTGASQDRLSMREFNPFTLPARNQLAYCALFRREVWEAVGGYSPDLVHGYEDWDFWIGAAEIGYTARRIPEPLFHYRVRPGSMFHIAVRHDSEIRALVRARHPRLYRPWMRALRFGFLALADLRSTLRRAVAGSRNDPAG